MWWISAACTLLGLAGLRADRRRRGFIAPLVREMLVDRIPRSVSAWLFASPLIQF
jgi:hypothetical protein